MARFHSLGSLKGPVGAWVNGSCHSWREVGIGPRPLPYECAKCGAKAAQIEDMKAAPHCNIEPVPINWLPDVERLIAQAAMENQIT